MDNEDSKSFSHSRQLDSGLGDGLYSFPSIAEDKSPEDFNSPLAVAAHSLDQGPKFSTNLSTDIEYDYTLAVSMQKSEDEQDILSRNQLSKRIERIESIVETTKDNLDMLTERVDHVERIQDEGMKSSDQTTLQASAVNVYQSSAVPHDEDEGQHDTNFRTLCDELGISSVPYSQKLLFKPFLGKGAFGRVYKVSGFPNGGVYAAKVLYDNTAMEQTRQREDKVLDFCDSPYIVCLYTICHVKTLTKSKVLIMELMEDNFKNYFSECSSQRPAYSIIGIMIQVARGLDYLHTSHPKIIHRDLKASNVLLRDISNDIPIAKIGDFGLARFVTSMRSTMMTAIGGTLHYLAPEVDDKTVYNEKCDIFSFGHLLLSASLGKFIENLPNVREISNEIERRKELTSKVRDFNVQAVIRSCLWFPEISNRPTAKQLIEALESINKNPL